MSELHVTLNGLPVETATIHEPHRGPWFAVVKLVRDEAPVSGAVTLKVGSATWTGTVDPKGTGTFGGRGTVRVVAGANGWGQLVGRRDYQSDAGVAVADIARDVAGEVGETLSTFAPQRTRIGNHFARTAGPAGKVLDAVIGTAGWWVDRAGKTVVGQHAATPVAAGVILGVQDFDHRSKHLKLSVSDVSKIQVGQTVTTDLVPGTLTISGLEIQITPQAITLAADCGDNYINEVADLLSAIARRATASKLYGVYEYRVIDMVADRARLQSTDPAAGLPDLSYIEQWPGIAGAHVQLRPATIVLVQFVNGSSERPVIVGFQDGRQESPLGVEIGKTNPAAAARQGDTVEVLLPPAVFTGSMGGTPVTGVLTFTIAKTLGTITSGTPLVRLGLA